MRGTVRRSSTRSLFGVPLALVFVVGVATPAAADPENPVWVAESDIQAITASTGWAVDYGAQPGVFSVESPPGDIDTSLRLDVASASQQMTVQYRFGQVDQMPWSDAGDDFATLRSMLADASFAARGDSIANFQVNVIYRPVDAVQFGVSGTSPCAQTGIDDWCYATLKYQPTTYSATTFTSYDVSQSLEDGLVPPAQSGWWRSQRIGQYATPGSPDDVSLNDMLTQISELRVFAFGVSLGSGVASGTVYLHDLTFAGVTYRFGAPIVVVDAPLLTPPLLVGLLACLLFVLPASFVIARRRGAHDDSPDGVERVRARSAQGGV